MMFDGQFTGNGMYAKPYFNRVKDVSSSSKQQQMRSCEKSLYSNLTRYSNEKCRYCCRLFFNKLQLYMHNTRHMYIPVEKLEISENSIKSLHILSQNLIPEIPEESQITQILINTEETVVNKRIKNVGFKKMLSKTYKRLQEIKETSEDMELDIEILNYKDNLLKDLMTDCKVNLGENIPMPFHKTDTRLEPKTTKNTEPDNSILSNFTNKCMVNLNDFFTELRTDVTHISKDHNSEIYLQTDSNVINTKSSQYRRNPSFLFNNLVKESDITRHNELYKSGSDTEMNTESNKNKSKELILNNMLIVGNKLNNSSILEVESKIRNGTVSYDKLIKDVKGGVSCRICSKQFTNRYEGIVHESRHILLRIPRIDMYIKNKPLKIYHQCNCLEKFPTLKLYMKHKKKCLKQTSLPTSSCDGANQTKIKKERKKKQRKKKLNTDKNYQNRDVTSKTKKLPKNFCPYCKSDSVECTEQCSEIRSDTMRSGNSTYFCKECYTKMEANLTKVGLYNGHHIRRCVVCNSVGIQFVLAFMTAECVLGI